VVPVDSIYLKRTGGWHLGVCWRRNVDRVDRLSTPNCQITKKKNTKICWLIIFKQIRTRKTKQAKFLISKKNCINNFVWEILGNREGHGGFSLFLKIRLNRKKKINTNDNSHSNFSPFFRFVYIIFSLAPFSVSQDRMKRRQNAWQSARRKTVESHRVHVRIILSYLLPERVFYFSLFLLQTQLVRQLAVRPASS
jgi:hypothetical protein